MKLISYKECDINRLYEMYQKMPLNELDFYNEYKNLEFYEFKEEYLKIIEDEKQINEKINSNQNLYVLEDCNKYIGYIGIRTTLNDFWINRGSQIFYQILPEERNKGYGFNILKLGIEEVKKLGLKQIRINCDNNNLESKKIILKNGGVIDKKDYKTKLGISSSYIIR